MAAMAATLLLTLAGGACAAGGEPVLATNNAAGRYEDGLFRLPPLADPKDKYVLLLTVDGKLKPAINLPAGATGLVFGENAAPTGRWSWAYALQRAELPPLQVATADALNVPAFVLAAYEGRLRLEWPKVAGANSYRVAISTWENAKNGKPADWGEEAKISNTCGEPELKELCNVEFDAEPGNRYRWTVTAIDPAKVDMARSMPRTIDAEGSKLAKIKKSGWSLQRSDSGSDDDKKGALFSYARAEDATTPRLSAYSAALALIWQPEAGFSQHLFPRASVETRRTSSGKEKESDATIVRAGVYGARTWRNAEGFRKGYNWTAAAKYEEARKEGTRKGILEFRVMPFLGPLGRHINIPAVGDDGRDSAANIRPDRFPLLQIMPLWSVGAELGKTFEAGSSTESEDRIKRLRTDLGFEMRWPALSGALGVLSVSSYGGGTYWRLPGQGAEYHLGQAGITISLTPQVSFDIAYKVGEEAPNFKFSRTTNVGVGFKF